MNYLKYIPHGIDINIFKPLSEEELNSSEFLDFKKTILGDKEYDFILFFNSRNMRRKQIPDSIYAWKLFMDKLTKEQQDKCLFILHTQPIDDNGTDLPVVIEYFMGKNANLKISPGRLHPKFLNYFYNIADLQILISSNEGWGLSLTEALAAGTPILANVQGGMQDQMGFKNENGDWLDFSKSVPSNHNGTYKNHGEWAFPVFPNNKSLQGSPLTPYIWDTRCSPEDVANKLHVAYTYGRKRLKEMGLKGREWITQSEVGFTSERMAERLIESMDYIFENWKPKERYELINATSLNKENKYNHNLSY